MTNLPNWKYYNPTKIEFGSGMRHKLAEYVAGNKVLVVCSNRGRLEFQGDRILNDLLPNCVWCDTIKPNPELEDLETQIAQLSEVDVDTVVAFGGGSVLDSAKVIAAGLKWTGKLRQLIDTPGLMANYDTLPVVAIPTTSGTGSEVTPFATVWDEKNKKKLSLAHERLFPKLAIVDPELTLSLPSRATLATSLDALNQAFESIWNKNNTPVSFNLATQSIRLGMASIPALNQDLNNLKYREMIAEASLLSGLAISQTRTAICHSISYPLTAHYGLDHGLACASTMSAVAEIVLLTNPECLVSVAKAAGYKDAEVLVQSLNDLLTSVNLRKHVRTLLPEISDILALKNEMFTPERAENFILALDTTDVEKILRASFE